MISVKARELVGASVPLIRDNGDTIAGRMYELLYERYSCVRELFDEPEDPSDSQIARFAEALLVYAGHINNLSPLRDEFARIHRRHVDVGVEPKHYGLMAECLLQAMRDVLGEAADDDFLAAWSEAYTALAGIFIANESDLRKRDGDSAPRVA